MPDRLSGLTTYAWRAGELIRPLPFASLIHMGNAAGFQTLPAPGDLAAVGAPFPWSVHFGLDAEPLSPGRLITHGYSIAGAASRNETLLVCLAVEPQALVGECAAHVRPQLFSGEMDVRAHDGNQWLGRDDYCVLLRVETAGAFLRFCVVAGPNEPTELRAIAQLYLEDNVRAKWDAEWTRRARYLQNTGAEGDRADALAAACEVLHARLRAPEGELAHIWSAADAPDDNAFDLNQLFPLVMAWSNVDPPVARRILDSAFDTQADDGSLAAVVQPVGRAVYDMAPLPLLACATARVWDAHREDDFLANVLPKLDTYLAWVLRSFDPGQNEMPRWPARNSAWHLDEFDDRVATRDASQFLLVEIGAFLELARQAPADAVDTMPMLREQDRLGRLASSAAQPSRGSELHNFVYARVFNKELTRADSIAATGARSGPVMDAALCIAQQPVSQQLYAQSVAVPVATNWLELHRRPVLAIAALVMGAVVLGVISLSLFKRSLNVPSAETIFGLAQRLYQEGKYDEALQFYQQIETSSHDAYPVELPMANAHFKLGQWAAAETYYRNAAKRDPWSPRPALNLCLTLYRQGRLAEAEKCYLVFIENFGPAYPELGQRATKARELIAERRVEAQTVH